MESVITIQFFPQVKGTSVCAVGGYNGRHMGEREFPGEACITLGDKEKGWTSWEEKSTTEKRSSFMSTLAPLSWINSLCV